VSGGGLRVAVVGAGRIGALHAELLRSRVAGAELAAVTDVDAEAATRVAARHGVPVAPLESILADDGIEAVAICSSTDTHVDLVVRAAEAGKAILCEKPLSLDLTEVDRALDAVERSAVFLQVGFNRRFDAAHRSVQEAVAAGTIGEVHIVRITSRDPSPPPLDYVRVSGGIFLDMTIHDFDMARFVTGSEVLEVFARGAVRITPALSDVGDVDTAVITLSHENGAFTVIDNSRRAVYGYDQRVEAFGSAGLAASENPPAHSGVVLTAVGSSGPPLPAFFLERYVPSYVAEWEAFVRALREGLPSPVSGADGRAPLAIGLAAWRSVRSGRAVQVAEIG
jgi:myo-inositol 2-dehydrogenase/D-chiro-inositol 1-dehydrogenase